MAAGPTLVRLLIVVLLYCLFGQSHGATQSQQKAAELATLSQQIQDLTTSVPPELAAYALLRVVELKGVSKTEQQHQLIEQAYMLAGQSPYAVRMTAAGGTDNTRATYLSEALTQGLDALSLRTRAVRAMLKIDPERARDLFQQLRPLALAKRSCSDSMLYDPAAYYLMAGQVYHQGFDQQAIAQGLPADFLESVFRDVDNASEVGPAADLLRTLQYEPEVLARAEGAFARSLSRIRGDYRSFAATQGNLTRNVTRLAQVQGRASRSLLEAVRAYIIANESGEVCADNASASTAGLNSSATSPNADEFASLNQVLERNGITPIRATDVKPGRLIAASESNTQAYWQSPAVESLLAQLKALRSGDKGSPQWQEAASSLLIALREWIDTSTEPSEEDFYIEKTALYSQMLSLTPADSSIYDEALSEYVAFLSEVPLSDDVQIFRLWNIQNLVRRTRFNHGNTELARQKMEDAIEDAPSPSIALYGYLLQLEGLQASSFGAGFGSSRS